jgi:hypothetical protein
VGFVRLRCRAALQVGIYNATHSDQTAKANWDAIFTQLCQNDLREGQRPQFEKNSVVLMAAK